MELYKFKEIIFCNQFIREIRIQISSSCLYSKIKYVPIAYISFKKCKQEKENNTCLHVKYFIFIKS